MKSKIILPIILSAILLTACNSESQPAEQSLQEESVITTTLETEEAETETTSEATETSAEADEKAETAVISGNTSSEYFDYFTFDLGKYEEDIKDHPLWIMKPDTHRDCMLLSKNLLCAVYQYQEPDQERMQYLRIYDIDRDEMLAEIPFPENSYFDTSYSHEKNDNENVLVRVYLYKSHDTETDYSELTVYKDYTYDIVDDGSTPYPGIDYFNTGIFANDPCTDNITNLQTNTVLITPAEGRIALYNSSIDKNRFIFKNGYDSYIGIYDYSTGEITEMPDSENLKPIGYYGGKIYAYLTNTAADDSEQGIGEIYSFDIETLEKKNFMVFHTPDENHESYLDCYMTQNCGYMAVSLSYGNSFDKTAYLISLDSGEILAKHENNGDLQEELENGLTYDGVINDIMYADGRVALVNFGTDKLLVLDPKE